MENLPGDTEGLSAALARAIWVSSQSGRLPEAVAQWVVRELALADAVVAEALKPEWRARLPEREPEDGVEGPGVAVAPVLAQTLTDVLYALARTRREPGGQAAAEWEVAGTRWMLLGMLARTYASIGELLTPAVQLPWLLGVMTPGMGRGRGVRLEEVV
jgi:hypothetical protein